MKIDYKLLAASGILILSAAMIILQTGHHRNDSVSQEPAKLSNSHGVPKLAGKPRDMSPLPGHAAAGSASSTVGGALPPQTAPSSPSSDINSPAPGFQLADDVQLPAVILALSAAEKNPTKKVPEPIAAAMRGIIDTFYQDLAESARSAAAGGNQATTLETAADGTVIIQKGPAVDRARARANETYRALFGADAFNRMTMNALLESQLPVDAGTGGK